MTDVLILGGTGWLSGRIAQRWLLSGAAVTCLARGERPAPDGATLAIGNRDDPGAYDVVSRTDWDHVVDISSRAEHVRGAVDALWERASRWTYVSSMSVYADDMTIDADETAPLVAAAASRDDDYGAQKVAAENTVRELRDDRTLIVRPGLIVGDGDPSDRFGYWAAAFLRAHDESVLVPVTSGREVQVIDADDLAQFVVTTTATGVVNAIGDRHPFADVLSLFRARARHDGEVVEADDDWLVAHGVDYWMGERSLPLWLPADMPGFMCRSNDRYREAGGELRPLADTVASVIADEDERGVDRPRRAGLTRDDELALLRLLGPHGRRDVI
ncbi:NAD-dependent epimerase/dehydratase family protein [Microbacterium hydrocarbonoxydans]|uniref:NAD-dependent epimerase/dehydratase family protein n=1 Tax=Microbacterium hydrocarbonoxydans TaxID=273678 RepID=UPI002041995D|nr:NAD-dependent epimerase/dehydratase family protein [Microbacterium hydrocarbonoxydans]MCM3780296.1 NAD-dependent epimerase/dehydratase family protein [Microbacterium hydrocarbonoxydans]